MKSTPKLKEILADLGIEFDAAIGKEELRELVLQKDALTKWEEKHPDQKKVRAYCLATAWPPDVHVHVHPHPLPCALQAPSKARAAGGGGGSATAMGDMFFTMMDNARETNPEGGFGEQLFRGQYLTEVVKGSADEELGEIGLAIYRNLVNDENIKKVRDVR